MFGKLARVLVLIAALGFLGGAVVGCQSTGGYSGGSDGHAGHSH